MFESIILGITQGIAEWLPVSSEGLIFIIKTNFFYAGEGVRDIASLALFLHFGTFLAALVYFRKDVCILVKELIIFLSFRSQGKISSTAKEENSRNFSLIPESDKNRKVLIFLIISTLISGVLGYGLLTWVDTLGDNLALDKFTSYVNFGIGILLLITAWLLFQTKKGGEKKELNLEIKDGVILGLTQTFASLPGLSRSGLTVSALLLRKFDSETAIKLSFLMSLPIVLGGNIVLNLNKFTLSKESLVGLLFSFVFGLITINILLKLAKKINFAWFVLVFAVLMIAVGIL